MKESAGLLIYRFKNGILQVFLIHPGGPFFKSKDAGIWSIPKGEVSAGEDPLNAALRELQEETGFEAHAPFLKLTAVKQSSYKMVHAWAAEGNYDPAKLRSNTFPLEWPPGSGKIQNFPEADRAQWFTIPEARRKILKGQIPLLDELERKVTGWM
ncbi:NUDIX domain-containing protein [bacterium]|nr:NUDIX domain-containing protein [bacterium]MCI0606396.1 NUDIX domain-containing protein [bacterium]